MLIGLAFYIDSSNSSLHLFINQQFLCDSNMRILRVQHAARKTVIYHPSISDLWKRMRCLFGMHEYETVLEYPSVGAKEEMCMHCMNERYSVKSRSVIAAQTSNPA